MLFEFTVEFGTFEINIAKKFMELFALEGI